MGEETDWNGGSPWLFFLGLIIFLAAGLLFVADLIRGVDVLRSLAGNAVGVALLIIWAAHDTLRNPESEVASTRGAAGTALLLYGLYLLIAGVVIAVTGLVHDRLQLGIWYVGMAVVTILLGLVIFPRDAFSEDNETATAQETSTETEGETADEKQPDRDSTEE